MCELHLGDFKDVLPTIATNSVDLVVVDPPYELSVRHDGGKLYANKGITKSNLDLADANIDLGFDAEHFCNEILRVMRGVNIYIWCNKKQIPFYIDYFVNGLHCKFDILCWHKTNALPTYNNKYLTDTEYLLYFQSGGMNHPSNYADASTYYLAPINALDKEIYGHPTVKPLDFTERLIRNSSNPGDTVLDCFMGSGTTGVACRKLNRKFIGIEINPTYFDTAKARIDNYDKPQMDVKYGNVATHSNQVSLF